MAPTAGSLVRSRVAHSSVVANRDACCRWRIFAFLPAARALRQKPFELTLDAAFGRVIRACAQARTPHEHMAHACHD